MLPRESRFSFRNKLPKNVFHSQSFTVRYQENNKGLAVAVVVSKKVDKRAVIRNKIKRRLIGIIQKEIKTDTPVSLVFYVKKQALNESSNLGEEIKKIHGII